jgi:transposase
MAMGKRERDRQPTMWVATTDLPTAASHPFYARLNRLFAEQGFDDFAETACHAFYADTMGRPGLPPGIYFRLLFVGYFEGLDSERGIAWRAADSLTLRDFLGVALGDAPPDHSTIPRTRRLIDVDTHREVFTWVLERLAAVGLVKGKTIGIDATTLEANAALAQHRAPRHRRHLSGVLDEVGRGLGHQDTDASGVGATGSQAEEEGGQQGLDASARSRCAHHEDEGRPDPSRA